MATLLQHTSVAWTTNQTSVALQFPQALQAPSRIIVWEFGTYTSAASVGDTVNTYTKQINDSTSGMIMWDAPNPSNNTQLTVTDTIGGTSTFGNLAIFEFSGLTGFDLASTLAQGSGSGTHTGNSLTTTAPGDMVMSCITAAFSMGVITPGSGFNLSETQPTAGGGAPCKFATEYQTGVGQGAIAPAFSATVSQAWSIFSAAWKAQALTSNPGQLIYILP